MALTDTFFNLGPFSFSSDTAAEENIWEGSFFKTTTSSYNTYIRNLFTITADAPTSYTIRFYVRSAGNAVWGVALKTIPLSGNQTDYADIFTISTLSDGDKELLITLETDGNLVRITKFISQTYKS